MWVAFVGSIDTLIHWIQRRLGSLVELVELVELVKIDPRNFFSFFFSSSFFFDVLT
jgi:hypothetical protein